MPPSNNNKNNKNHGMKMLLLALGLYLKKIKIKSAQASTNAQFCFFWVAAKVIPASSPPPPPPLPHFSSPSLPSSHYHIGQGLLIVPRQRAENGERKGIMTVRREKRGSERKEGQTGYYEREGWEQWRHLEPLFAFLSHGLRSQSDWSIRPAM